MLVLAIDGVEAFAPSKRCQLWGIAESFVYVTVTRAPADAVSWLVLKEIPLPWLDVLMQSVVPDGMHDDEVTGVLLLVAVGLVLPVAPSFNATSIGDAPSPTGTSSRSPAAVMKPLVPPGACHDHTCLPVARLNAITLPLNVEVKTRSPATSALPTARESSFEVQTIRPLFTSIASSSPVPVAAFGREKLVSVKLL